MKQKMVVKVTMNGEKYRCKALKIAVGFSGVESASLKGNDKSQIEVTGDGVDPVQLTNRLRKSVGYAELVSVTAMGGDQKEDEKNNDKKEDKPPAYVWHYNPPVYLYQEMPYSQQYDPCSIM